MGGAYQDLARIFCTVAKIKVRIHVARSRHIICVERGRRADGIGCMEIVSGSGGIVWGEVRRPAAWRAATARWRNLATGRGRQLWRGWQPPGGLLHHCRCARHTPAQRTSARLVRTAAARPTPSSVPVGRGCRPVAAPCAASAGHTPDSTGAPRARDAAAAPPRPAQLPCAVPSAATAGAPGPAVRAADR